MTATDSPIVTPSTATATTEPDVDPGSDDRAHADTRWWRLIALLHRRAGVPVPLLLHDHRLAAEARRPVAERRAARIRAT